MLCRLRYQKSNPPVLLGMYCTLESGRRGVGWGLLSGQNKVSCCLDFVDPSLFKINPCCLKLPKGWLISLFLVPRKIFLLRALFFLLAFSHKNVEQIQWHITITLRKKNSPGKKTPLEKDKVSILCTHPFFCDSYLLLLPPPPFSPCPARNIVYNNKLFLLSTLLLSPALKK